MNIILINNKERLFLTVYFIHIYLSYVNLLLALWTRFNSIVSPFGQPTLFCDQWSRMIYCGLLPQINEFSIRNMFPNILPKDKGLMVIYVLFVFYGIVSTNILINLSYFKCSYSYYFATQFFKVCYCKLFVSYTILSSKRISPIISYLILENG